MLLRGAYYEGWHLAATPTRERHLADFVDNMASQLPQDTTINPAEAMRRLPSSSGGSPRSGGAAKPPASTGSQERQARSQLEKHHFMVTLATTLDAACSRREFDDFILVAPRRSLGELRGLLSKRVQGASARSSPRI